MRSNSLWRMLGNVRSLSSQELTNCAGGACLRNFYAVSAPYRCHLSPRTLRCTRSSKRATLTTTR